MDIGMWLLIGALGWQMILVIVGLISNEDDNILRLLGYGIPGVIVRESIRWYKRLWKPLFLAVFSSNYALVRIVFPPGYKDIKKAGTHSRVIFYVPKTALSKYETQPRLKEIYLRVVNDRKQLRLFFGPFKDFYVLSYAIQQQLTKNPEQNVNEPSFYS